jgi:hypothetical protein
MNRSKMAVSLLVIALIPALTGCVPMPVLNSLFSESESLFEPQLLGTWEKLDPENKGLFKFDDFDLKENKYSVGFDGEYKTARLGKIGDNYYLDIVELEQSGIPDQGQRELNLVPTAEGYQVNSAFVLASGNTILDFRTDKLAPAISDQSLKIKFTIRPLHEIYRLRLENDQLTIWYLDDEDFEEQIEKGAINLVHQKEPFGLITADRLEMQKFLQAYGESDNLFRELGTYRRAIE